MSDARAIMLYDLAIGSEGVDQDEVNLEFSKMMHTQHTDAEYALLANTVDAAMIDSDVPASEFAR